MADSIDELADIVPIDRGSVGEAVHQYGEAGWSLCMRLQIELDMAAGDAEAAIKALHGHPLLFGLNAKLKARRIAKRLRRAQDAAFGAAQEIRKLHNAYVEHVLSKTK